MAKDFRGIEYHPHIDPQCNIQDFYYTMAGVFDIELHDVDETVEITDSDDDVIEIEEVGLPFQYFADVRIFFWYLGHCIDLFLS